jgi:hypothetical protein
MMMIITSQLGIPSGRCDEHSSKFFPQLETKVYRSKKKKPIRLKVMLASFTTAQDNIYGALLRVINVGADGPCAWWITSPLGTPRGRYDEYSS